MPYTKANAPTAVKKLPSKGQDVWIAAYNSALKQYAGDEAKAHATAWAAAKKVCVQKPDGSWVMKKGRGAGAVEHVSLPMLTRDMITFEPRTADDATRTVEVTWTTGATVRRSGFFDGSWDEELLLNDENVDLSRLNGGAPVLNSHRAHDLGSVLGVVVDGSAHLLGPKGQRKGRATLRFSDRPEVEGVWQDVRNGIVRNVSCGYAVQEWQRIDPPPNATGKDAVRLMRAVRWSPMELSLVAVPADAGAQVRADRDLFPCTVRRRSGMDDDLEADDAIRSTETDPQPPAAPPEPPPPPPSPGPQPGQGAQAAGLSPAECAAILRNAGTLGLPAAFGLDLMARDGMTMDGARAALIDERARLQGGTHVATQHVRVVRDEAETRCGAIRDMILGVRFPASFPIQGDAPAREYVGYRLIELARLELEAAGIRTRGRSPQELAALALTPGYGVRQSDWIGIRGDTGYHTTSDLASVFLDVVYKSARQAYALAPQTFQLWAQRATHKDYRLVNSVQLSNLGVLPKVPEHGEYTYGVLTDSKEAYKVEKYGKIIGIDREAIINDDLGLLTTIPARLGVAARNTESDVVYAALLANAALGADGIPLFHANHGNLAGTPAVMTAQTLAAGYSAMSMQKDPDGKTLLNIRPRYILVPPLQLATASQVLGAFFPATAANLTPDYIRSLTPIDEPRLQGGVTVGGVTYAGSSTAWYLAADPNQAPTVEYAYLEGQEGVYTETQAGFEVDGIKTKVRLDIGAKPLDYRGLYENAGA
jgi:cation transport regulator ChaB